MNIGKAIKKIRTDKGIAQGVMAKSCKISQTGLYLIEKGDKRPTGNTLKKICKYLGVPETIIYIYGLEESDIPKGKREVFKVVYPGVEEMIKKLIVMD